MEKTKGLLMGILVVLFDVCMCVLADNTPVPDYLIMALSLPLMNYALIFMVLCLPLMIYVLSTIVGDYRSTLTHIVLALILTLVSGLYIVKPFMLDAEAVYFGFPFPWLTAGRSLWLGPGPWHFTLTWFWLIGDFAIYVLIVTTARGIYVMAVDRTKRRMLIRERNA